MLQDFDLDHYNITSDDLRPIEDRSYVKGNTMKGHPLVPRLDFAKIFSWRNRQNSNPEEEDNSHSDSDFDEADDEVLSESRKILPPGSELPTGKSEKRVEEMKERKE